MKAIEVSGFGAPEVLRLTELPDPVPGPGEVAIDVTHAAVGLIDVFIGRGCTVTGPACRSQPSCARQPGPAAFTCEAGSI